MNWIHRYQLFLFDFDGLLVNTEELHYKAYVIMCAQHNVKLHWNFYRYAELAHQSATGVQEQLYKEFPVLKSIKNWDLLYAEKKRAFLQLLQEGNVELMPGVADLLQALEQAQIPRCVVTHSSLQLITTIRQQHPILDTIPHWITREDYSQPKPHSECYEVAITRLAKENDVIIGFEDSPRGLAALKGTRAIPVVVCPPHYPYINPIFTSSVHYYPSFTAINDENSPTNSLNQVISLTGG